MTDAQVFPEDLQAARALIATLQAQVKTHATLLGCKDEQLSLKTNELSVKGAQLQEQAHSVLQIQADRAKLQKKRTLTSSCG